MSESDNSVLSRSRHVSCDGGGGELGHPKVYLEIKEESITCPYCGKVFTYIEGDEG